jgi:signal peptidase I
MAKKKSKSGSNVVADAKRGGAPAAPLSKRIWENIKSFAGAVLIYLVIKTLLLEAFRIPSGSMIPSLLIGDWLFVNKVAYGANIPFTQSHLPGYTQPGRGDVVVFVSPYQADEAEIGNDPTPILVKRLIGMPGDTIYMRQGLVYINGLAQRQGYAAASNPKGNPEERSQLMDWQHKIELTGSRFGAPPKNPNLDHWGPLLVPQGHYFMMGDNRYGSKDSRYWGVVPRENVRGRPMFIYYSAPCMSLRTCFVGSADSDRPAPAITDIRWGRIGHWVR